MLCSVGSDCGAINVAAEGLTPVLFITLIVNVHSTSCVSYYFDYVTIPCVIIHCFSQRLLIAMAHRVNVKSENIIFNTFT